MVRKIQPIAAVVLPALFTAALLVMPVVAQAAPGPWNYSWRPGHPVPSLAPDEVLKAWPVQSEMGELQSGQAVPMTEIGYTTSSGKFVRTASSAGIRSVTNLTGLVNLLASPDLCENPQLIKKLGLRWVAVGTTFSLIRPVTQEFDYSQGQSSTLAVGESASGDLGTFTLDGSASVSSDADQGFPASNRGNERYLTEFVFGKFRVKCGRADATVRYYEVRPYEWAGGDDMQHPKAPRATYCVSEAANQHHAVTFTKGSTAAINFSAGFSVLGFIGSAQTGYDTRATVKFIWAKKSHGHLCGTADYPAHAPKVLVAKRMRKPVLAAVAALVAAVLLSVGLSQRHSGPPPLGTGNVGPGLQCEGSDIRQPVTMGIFALTNSSDEKVTLASVRLAGGEGQKMASPAFLAPIVHTTLLGAQPWPPAGAAWRRRRLAAGAAIAPHVTTNLVFAQTRTSTRTRSAAVQITYTAGGTGYTLTEAVRVLVAADCT